MRYLPMIPSVGDEAAAPLLRYVVPQVNLDAEAWKRYGRCEQTRRERLQSEEFDYLRCIGDGYMPMRRYILDFSTCSICERRRRHETFSMRSTSCAQ